MSTTDKLYHLTCPIHLTGGQEQQCLTKDIRELFTHSRLLAQFPTITGQLFMNGILTRQMQILARTERDLKPIFHKRKLIYGFAKTEEGINITDLMATMAPQMDKLTTVKYILAKTEPDHWGAQTNRINPNPFHTPALMESGAALVLLLYAGTKDEPVDWRNIGYGSKYRSTETDSNGFSTERLKKPKYTSSATSRRRTNHQKVSEPPNHGAYGKKDSSTR